MRIKTKVKDKEIITYPFEGQVNLLSGDNQPSTFLKSKKFPLSEITSIWYRHDAAITHHGTFGWDDKFKTNEGLYPLLCLRETLNPLLIGYKTTYSTRYTHGLAFRGLNVTNFRSQWYGAHRKIIPYDNNDLFTGFYSCVGIKNKEYVPDRHLRGIHVKGEYDVFFLAVTKHPEKVVYYQFGNTGQLYVGSYNRSSNVTMVVKDSDIVILVNKQLMQSKNLTSIMKKYYGNSCAIHARKFIENTIKENKLKVVYVEDEYLQKFISKGVPLQETSILDIINIEKEIKEKVFETL